MTANGTSPAPPERPTRVRYGILALVCLLAMITYMDRAMYGSAKADLMAAVNRPVSDFFYVLVAFQLAYALFEIPTGWLGDTFGPRTTLLRIVLWWSLFVALTGFAGWGVPGAETLAIGFGVLVAMQFLFGIGEAGAFPNMSKAIYNWFPEDKRAFAKGAVWMSARFMGGLTPCLWVLIVEIGGYSWRQALWLFAGLAVVWCAAWYVWFRNNPGEHRAANEAERALVRAGKGSKGGHAGVPWKLIYSNPSVWALCLMYMATNFNWYFLMYYLPGKLKGEFAGGGPAGPGRWVLDTFGGDGAKVIIALIGGAPLLIGMLGCYLGGVLSDWHFRVTGDRKWARRTTAMIGYGMAGVCYLAAAGCVGGNLLLFAGTLILVGFFNDLMMAPAWATSQDIGRGYSAIVGGTMNMVGNLGATLGNLVTGLILKYCDGASGNLGYQYCFVMYACVYAAGVGLWLLIDPTRPVGDSDQVVAGTSADEV